MNIIFYPRSCNLAGVVDSRNVGYHPSRLWDQEAIEVVHLASNVEKHA